MRTSATLFVVRGRYTGRYYRSTVQQRLWFGRLSDQETVDRLLCESETPKTLWVKDVSEATLFSVWGAARDLALRVRGEVVEVGSVEILLFESFASSPVAKPGADRRASVHTTSGDLIP